MDSDLPVTVHGFGAVCGVVVVFAKMRLSNDAKSYQNKGKSTEISRFQCFFGGDKRDRTADLLNAIGFLGHFVILVKTLVRKVPSKIKVPQNSKKP